MRKVIAIILVTLILLAVLGECRKRGKQSSSDKKSSKKHDEHKVDDEPHYLTPDQPEFWFNCLLALCNSSSS
jgi:Mg2+/citrate symporter